MEAVLDEIDGVTGYLTEEELAYLDELAEPQAQTLLELTRDYYAE